MPQLKMVSGPRLLETAFHAAKAKGENRMTTKEATVEMYGKLFIAPASTAPGQQFERFSLIDPHIRTFIASTTDPAV